MRSPYRTSEDICEGIKNLTLCEQEIHKDIRKSTTPLPTNIIPTVGFAIDIDGVLCVDKRGANNTLLPGALATIHKLHDMKVPFVLLTNRLYYDAQRGTAALRKILELPALQPSQLIYRLTPFKFLLPRFWHTPVLVIGFSGEQNFTCRTMMRIMGFENVYIPEDFYGDYPELAPAAFSNSNILEQTDTFSRAEIERFRACRDKNGLKVDISAIIVFDSGPCGLKSVEQLAPHKLLVQILRSQSGDLSKPAISNGNKALPNDGYQQSQAPFIYYEICSSKYQVWRSRLESAWKEETGRALLNQHEIGGKPASSMFTYTRKMLDRQQKALHGENAKGVEKIVMIGDTPDADIRGPNWYKKRPGQNDVWKSALVESGVWKWAKHGLPERQDVPDAFVPDVQRAVHWGLTKYGAVYSEHLELISLGNKSDGDKDDDSKKDDTVGQSSENCEGSEDRSAIDDSEFKNHDSDYEEYEEWDIRKHNKLNECSKYYQHSFTPGRALTS